MELTRAQKLIMRIFHRYSIKDGDSIHRNLLTTAVADPRIQLTALEADASVDVLEDIGYIHVKENVQLELTKIGYNYCMETFQKS